MGGLGDWGGWGGSHILCSTSFVGNNPKNLSNLLTGLPKGEAGKKTIRKVKYLVGAPFLLSSV